MRRRWQRWVWKCRFARNRRRLVWHGTDHAEVINVIDCTAKDRPFFDRQILSLAMVQWNFNWIKDNVRFGRRRRVTWRVPVGDGAQRRSAVEDDEHQNVGHRREEEQQGQEDVNDDADCGGHHRSLDVHGGSCDVATAEMNLSDKQENHSTGQREFQSKESQVSHLTTQ